MVKKLGEKKNRRVVGPNVECRHLRVKDSKPEIEETMKKGGLADCRTDW